jgi:hypothetical protein
MLFSIWNNGKTNCVSNVRDLSFILGLNYVWISRDASSVSFYFVKQRIIDQFTDLYAGQTNTKWYSFSTTFILQHKHKRDSLGVLL